MKYLFTVIFFFHFLIAFSQSPQPISENNFDDSEIKTDSIIENELKSLKSDQKIIILVTTENAGFAAVYIFNNAMEALNLSLRDGRINMIREAKNRNGEWQSIEPRQEVRCGTGYSRKVLDSKTMIKTQINSNTGNFETDFRIKLFYGNNVYYSNTYKGAMDLVEFEKAIRR